MIVVGGLPIFILQFPSTQALSHIGIGGIDEQLAEISTGL